jgi:hypothetical protein
MDDILKDVCFSVRRALQGQTLETLRAYTFEIDRARKLLRLRAHFAVAPSDDDLEAVSIVETEIDADFLDLFTAETDTEVVPPGKSLTPLSGGTAYLRTAL